MKIFLAGQHTYPGLIAELCGGGSGEVFIKQGAKAAMRLFMAGGGIREPEPSLEGILPEDGRRSTVYKRHGGCDENLSGGGESRHFVHDELLEISKKKRNANLSCREWNLPGLHCTRDQEGRMQLYLAGVWPWRSEGGYDETVTEYRPYILESFFYADEDTERLIPYFGDFLLDSGAFTFMQGKGGQPDWNEYIERYAAFIVRNKIEKYFELDIDSVVGYDKVLQFRAKLEKLTGRQSIPVWHRSRGQDEYIRHCEEYPYVAIGGLVDGAKKGEYARQYWKYFPWFINTAHKNGAKIHALGFTSLEGIRQFHFDSVDSTAWTTGNRFGYLYYFDGQTIRKKDAPKGHRICDPRTAALNNYVEWIKFQKYADKHL